MTRLITAALALVITAALALAICGDGAVAQNSPLKEASPAEAAAQRFPQPLRAGDLVGRTVLQPVESKNVLGQVKALVRSADGSVQVVVAYGGLLGFGARLIAVPLDAMALLGPPLVIIRYTPEQLDGFPTYGGAGTTPVAVDDIVRIGLAKPSH